MAKNKAKKQLTEKQRKIRIIIVAAIVAVALMVVGFAAMILYSGWRNDGGQERSTIAFETDNYEVNNCMLTYFYFTDLYNTYQNYGPYLQYMAPSQTAPVMTEPLSTQYYDNGTESGTPQTWHEYFINTTLSNVTGYLYYAEEALANGFEFADLDKTVDEHIAKLESDAKAIDLTLDEYLEKNYTSFVKEGDVRDALELQYFANEYMTKVQKDYKDALVEDDFTAYKEENMADLETADFYYFTLGADVAEDATEEEKTTASTLASAQADELLAKIEAETELDKKVEAFKSWVTTYLTEDNKAAEEPKTEEELAADIATQTAEATKKKRGDQLSSGGVKPDDSDFGKWAYDEEQEVGNAIKVETGSGIYTVYLLTRPAGIDESPAKNVHHILFTADEYGSDEEAKAKADAALKEFQGGTVDADSFKKFGEDNYKDAYARFENITADASYVAEFLDWIFAEDRQAGDSEVVKTTYGYHVMYLEGDGMPTWKSKAADSLVQTSMEEYAAKLQEKYGDAVDVDQNALLEVPDYLPAAAFTSSATDETTEETEAVEHDHDGDGVADHTDEEHTDEATEETEAAADEAVEEGTEETTDEAATEETAE